MYCYQVHWIGSDGSDNSDTSKVIIIPDGVNDRPIIDLDPSVPSSNYQTSFQERADPVDLHNGLTITDEDDVNLCSAVVEISNPIDFGERLVDNGLGDPLMNIIITINRIELVALAPLPIATFVNLLRMVCVLSILNKTILFMFI